MRSSHPVKVEITNRKGSNIIRMMHRFLGEESFRLGVHNYLKKHEYANAEQDNLWESLTEEAHHQDALPKNITVKKIMDKWTLQTGYPTITVDRDFEKKEVTITQRRTFSNTLKKRTPDEENCWWVPLSYTNAIELDFNNTHAKDWLECTTSKTEPSKMVAKTIEGQPNASEWVLFNVDISGLYKVQYDTKNWDLHRTSVRTEFQEYRNHQSSAA